MRRRGAAGKREPLRPRPPDQLLSWTRVADVAPLSLVLDTNVYVDSAAGRLPAGVCDLIARTTLFHCATALAELTVGVANADPARRDWATMRDHYAEAFAQMLPTRILTPTAELWSDAGVVAGILSRTQGFRPHQRTACLADALIFLTAADAGVPVLTADRDDFDLIQQIAPEGAFIHY